MSLHAEATPHHAPPLYPCLVFSSDVFVIAPSHRKQAIAMSVSLYMVHPFQRCRDSVVDAHHGHNDTTSLLIGTLTGRTPSLRIKPRQYRHGQVRRGVLRRTSAFPPPPKSHSLVCQSTELRAASRGMRSSTRMHRCALAATRRGVAWPALASHRKRLGLWPLRIALLWRLAWQDGAALYCQKKHGPWNMLRNATLTAPKRRLAVVLVWSGEDGKDHLFDDQK